jgi:putative ABC transport system permease protein
MTALRTMGSRLLDLLYSRRRERRLDEEIRTHLDLLTEQHMAAGMPRPEAERAARRAFGGVEQLKETYRGQQGLPLAGTLARDARFALRLMRRNPGFALTAVLVLGIGIGVNNMLFTILDAHTIRGLPIPHSERVLFLSSIDDRGADRGVSLADFEDMRASARHLSGLAAFRSAPMVVAGDGRPPERMDGAYVTADAFTLLGISPIRGRGFQASDDAAGAAAVALLNRDAWLSRYGGDPAILGHPLSIDGTPSTIVGIVPDRSGFPSTAAIWVPLAQAPGIRAEKRDDRTLQVFGRLSGEATAGDAIAELAGIADRLAQDHPETNHHIRGRVIPIDSRFLGSPTDPVWLAFMTVGFIVVLISCANVANLMLDRSLLRARELAIRASLGGSRTRLFQQLLVESAAIATVGATIGLLVAIGGIRVFRSAIPGDALPYWFDYSIDWRVLAALIGVSGLTVLVFGLAPAIYASKTDVVATLKDGGRSSANRRHGLTTAFLAAQLALSVVLLAHFAVGVRSSGPGLPSDSILDTPTVMTATLTLPPGIYSSNAARAGFYDALMRRVRGVPAIEAAALTSTLPFSNGESKQLVIDGRRLDEGARASSMVISITPSYFDALRLPLLQGRAFDQSDGGPGRESIIVNASFVEEFFPEGGALGRRIAIGDTVPTEGSTVPWLTIVGISPAVRQRRGRDLDPVVFVPWAAAAPATAALVVRSGLDTASLVATLRQHVQAVDAAMPIFRARTLPQVRHDADWNGRLSSGLILFLTFIAVTLATVGLYAVTGHRVSQTQHEIGIRMALGARPGQIARRVVQHTLAQAGIGFGAGILCTALWERVLPPASDEIGATDVLSLALVGAVLLGAVAIAAAVPVRRATRLDPLASIRAE